MEELSVRDTDSSVGRSSRRRAGQLQLFLRDMGRDLCTGKPPPDCCGRTGAGEEGGGSPGLGDEEEEEEEGEDQGAAGEGERRDTDRTGA